MIIELEIKETSKETPFDGETVIVYDGNQLVEAIYLNQKFYRDSWTLGKDKSEIKYWIKSCTIKD